MGKLLPRNNNTTGIVFDLKKFAIHDGPGIRTTVFIKGCPLQCIWCHNPESQNPDPQVVVKINRKKVLDLSYSETKDIIGKEVTVDEIMNEVKKDIDYYDESSGGVTFSGGEPMMQPEFLNALLAECKKLDLNTAVDTCGHATYETFEMILDKVDTFLYDIKLMNNADSVKHTGVGNRIILENLKLLATKGKYINVRVPIIPNITDTDKNLKQIIKFLKSLKTIKDVSILQYNKLGEGKEEKLNMVQRLKNAEPPPDERMEELRQLFNDNGFNCKIGG